jgi:hypothetical protein
METISTSPRPIATPTAGAGQLRRVMVQQCHSASGLADIPGQD